MEEADCFKAVFLNEVTFNPVWRHMLCGLEKKRYDKVLPYIQDIKTNVRDGKFALLVKSKNDGGESRAIFFFEIREGELHLVHTETRIDQVNQDTEEQTVTIAAMIQKAKKFIQIQKSGRILFGFEKLIIDSAVDSKIFDAINTMPGLLTCKELQVTLPEISIRC